MATASRIWRPRPRTNGGLEQLGRAARAVARIGAQIVVEPISGVDDYPLKTAADVLSVVDQVGEPNIALLTDIYHLSVNGDDVAAVLAAHADRVGHVQIADAPGRGRPGTGAIPIQALLAQLRAGGYNGWVGLEYQPDASTPDDFSWIDASRPHS